MSRVLIHQYTNWGAGFNSRLKGYLLTSLEPDYKLICIDSTGTFDHRYQ